MVKKIILSFIVVLLSGCGASIPMTSISSQSGPSLVGMKFGDVTYTTGAVDGSRYIPGYQKITKFHFDGSVQKEFIDVLKREMARSGALIDGSDSSAPSVNINFISTFYESNSTFYSLNVLMEISKEGDIETTSYTIKSSEGMTFGQKMNSRPSDHRNRAAKMLLDMVLKDLAVNARKV